ncbi:unnamed protein product [Discula destructiva]
MSPLLSRAGADAAALAAAGIGPPPQNVLNLAIADLVFATIFFFLSGYIAWRHGKAGMVCWPIFNTTFAARMVADIYQLVTKTEPMVPNAVTTMSTAAVIACITLTLIGCIYMCNCMLPSPNKHLKQKLMLGATHLFNTGGIGVATYAGAPSSTGEGGVINKKLNGIGNLIMLWVLFAVCAWMWPTFRKIQRYSAIGHPNAAPARWMFWATVAAMPFWLIRLAYLVTYAFDHMPVLDPVMGSFAVKLLLGFGTYFVASILLLIGGWFGVRKTGPGSVDEYTHIGDECGLQEQESGTDIEMMGRAKK